MEELLNKLLHELGWGWLIIGGALYLGLGNIAEAIEGFHDHAEKIADKYAEMIDAQLRVVDDVPVEIEPVAYRYQRKVGWGDIWRVTTVCPVFEEPDHWRVEELYVGSELEPDEATDPELAKYWEAKP